MYMQVIPYTRYTLGVNIRVFTPPAVLSLFFPSFCVVTPAHRVMYYNSIFETRYARDENQHVCFRRRNFGVRKRKARESGGERRKRGLCVEERRNEPDGGKYYFIFQRISFSSHGINGISIRSLLPLSENTPVFIFDFSPYPESGVSGV